MKLRCQPGEWAQVVSGTPAENHGLVIKVLYLVGIHIFSGPMWAFDGKLNNCFAVADACLVPLRSQPGQDETLEWAGRPNETPAEVIHELADGATT